MGVSNTFRQLVPAENRRYENEIVLSTQKTGKVCFNGTTYDACWAVDDEWNVITFSPNLWSWEEAAQHPWREEVYLRIGKT